MLNRRRRSVFAALTLAVALGSVPSAGALYQAHDRAVHHDPADWTPHVVDGKVTAILPMGNRVYVGGTFTQVKQTKAADSPIISKPGLFALNAATGQIDMAFQPPGWGIDPTPSVAKGVEALAPGPDGSSLFVGGAFSYQPVAGSPRKVLKLDAATGADMSSFSVSTGGSAVKDLAVSGDRLFLAGPFSTVQGATRQGLAAVDVDTGALDSDVAVDFTEPRQVTDPLVNKPRVESIAVSPDGETLVAGGNFRKADGQDRFQIALLDVTPGSAAEVLNWQTNRYDDRRTGQDAIDNPDDPFRCAEAFDTHIRDIDMAPDGKYFVVVTTGGFSRGTMCDTATRWETSARGTDLQPTWVDYDGGDSFTGVAVTGAAVYVGGHMRAMNNNYTDGSSSDAVPGPGHVAREGIAALDPASGLPLPWNPGRERGEGAWALASTDQGLWVGSDTDRLGGETHQKLGFFPLAGGAAVPVNTPQGLPGDLYRLGNDGSISRRVFGGASVGSVVPLPSSIDWNQMRGAFAISGRLYTGRSDGKLFRWAFDGNSLGTPVEVSLRGMETDLNRYFPISRMTGMFYDNGRVYFTLAGDKKLYFRYFLSEANPADDVVGAEILVASGDTDGRDWSKVTGMTMANGKMYWAENGAELFEMSFAGGKPTGTKKVAVANAGVAGRGMFLMPTNLTPPPVSIDPPAPPAPPAPPGPGPEPGVTGRSGYWMVGSTGSVYGFGEARHLGNAPIAPNASAVDLEPTPAYNGYWIIDDNGNVFALGDARHHGNADRSKLAGGEKVTSLSSTPSGNGYWIFTSRGRALALGDAVHYGDMAAVRLNGPVLDSIPTASGKGYFMVASDGGIFAFGDAKFAGSMGGKPLNAPVQSLVPNPNGPGYWLVASDGGVFNFTNRPFQGSMGGKPLNKPMTGMVPYGDGYLMVAEDGGIFNFSDKVFAGSLGSNPPAHPIVSVAALDE